MGVVTVRLARTLAEAIEDTAARRVGRGYRFIGERGTDDRFFSFAEIEEHTARHGGALQSLGLKKGDRVVLILPDNPDFAFAFLGAVRAGVIPVPIYPPPGLRQLGGYLENTGHIVARSGAKVVLTDAAIKKLLGTVQARAPELQKVVTIESLSAADEPLRPAELKPDDTCFLQFTSGSTSAPKGVIVSHANLAANWKAIGIDGIGLGADDAGASWLPLYHDMGLVGFLLGPLYGGVEVSFLPPMEFLKRPARWLQMIARHRGTVSFGPNFAYALSVKRIRPREVEGLDLSCWRVAGCGAEPIRAENLLAFADRFAELGFDRRALMPCFGMAESTLAVSFSPSGGGVRFDTVDGDVLAAEGRAEPVGSDEPGAMDVVACGQPFEGHDIAVFAADEEDGTRRLGDRQVGEIRLRGPSVTAGYFGDPDTTAQSFASGWLRTGDLGYLVDGELYVCGRSKELIIVHGRNYYPQDLEWHASCVAGVRKGNVIAFGTHQGEGEQVVIAFETSVADPEKRQALVREVRQAVQRASGLVVDDLVPLDAGVLPKTSSGKLKRAYTRQLYESGELAARGSIRKVDPVDVAKELAKSQWGYLRHALFGTKKQ